MNVPKLAVRLAFERCTVARVSVVRDVFWHSTNQTRLCVLPLLLHW
jgi:hypothetical protein